MSTEAGQQTTWLTQETYDRLSAELEEAKGPRRADIVAKIEAARDEGDLKENGGYHAAKDEQGDGQADDRGDDRGRRERAVGGERRQGACVGGRDDRAQQADEQREHEPGEQAVAGAVEAGDAAGDPAADEGREREHDEAGHGTADGELRRRGAVRHRLADLQARGAGEPAEQRRGAQAGERAGEHGRQRRPAVAGPGLGERQLEVGALDVDVGAVDHDGLGSGRAGSAVRPGAVLGCAHGVLHPCAGTTPPPRPGGGGGGVECLRVTSGAGRRPSCCGWCRRRGRRRCRCARSRRPCRSAPCGPPPSPGRSR